MNVLYLNGFRLCVPNIINLGIFPKNCTLSNLARLLDTASRFALFSVSGLKDETLTKSKPTRKLKHTDSILEFFEYFCQMSSKSILTISRYTVSKLVHFLRHSVDSTDSGTCPPVFLVSFELPSRILNRYRI